MPDYISIAIVSVLARILCVLCVGTARKQLVLLVDLLIPLTPSSDFIGASDPVESHGNLPSSLVHPPLHPHLLPLVICERLMMLRHMNKEKGVTDWV